MYKLMYKQFIRKKDFEIQITYNEYFLKILFFDKKVSSKYKLKTVIILIK